MSEISIRNISKSFDDKKVLSNISLEIEKGDIYGVLGLSGAGKSTLVRCINGLETFDEGEIYYEDQLLCSPTKRVKREDQRKLAMIFQSFNLLQQKTVLKNVEVALEIAKYPRKERKQKALDALELVGLSDKINAYPSQLSGGQQQRVAIARALVLDPKVILSDEATSALDPETTNSILDLLKELNQKMGLTIIMISHQMNVIERICNKVAIIDNSQIVEKGNMSDVFLSPKTDITKSLIYANHVDTRLEDDKYIRILFDGNVDEPLIANIVQDCQILVSIVYADTKVSEHKVYGQTIIRRPSEEKDVQKIEKYLNLKGISYEEVSDL